MVEGVQEWASLQNRGPSKLIKKYEKKRGIIDTLEGSNQDLKNSAKPLGQGTAQVRKNPTYGQNL